MAERFFKGRLKSVDRDLPRELRVTDKQRTIVGLIAPVINKLYEEKYSESNL